MRTPGLFTPPGRLVCLLAAALLGGSPGGAVPSGGEPSGAATLEDIYGPSGKRFQAGLGILNFEKAVPADPFPLTAYGIGVDDVVFSWKEIHLSEDVSECTPGAGGQTGGSCAAVSLETTNFYESRSRLTIQIVDGSPGVNNCNDDFVCSGTTTSCDPHAETTGCGAGVSCVPDYTDVGIDDFDCDDDGIVDVRVEVETEAESSPGERVTVNCAAPVGGACPDHAYRTSLPVSTRFDSEGVLFVASLSAAPPTVTVTYLDNDDGTGAPCSNTPSPADAGVVSATTSFFLNTGEMSVHLFQVVADDGDGDGFADTGETVTLAIGVVNRTGSMLTGVTARLATDDDKIDCVLDSLASLGTMMPGEETLSGDGGDYFVFRVSDLADRQANGLTDLDEYAATFSVTISADQFDTTTAPLGFELDLDLDAAGGGSPDGGYLEDFEAASGFGSFTTMNLDLGFQTGDPAANSDGYRCQYHDPDWRNSNNYNETTDCHLGPAGNEAATDAYYWQIHRTTAIDGGRAYTGTQSLYMGVFGEAADEHTTPMAVLEAAGMDQPVNLPATGNPALSMVHQVDFVDTRLTSANPGTSRDRGAVQLQLADDAGNPVGHWMKLEPYRNVYDQRAFHLLFPCTFDPIDDGSTEDDFFDPEDPARRLGPSTLCFPERTFAHMGNTFDPFNGDVGGTVGGLTPEGPALAGSLGVGSWVESRFSLHRFRGRRVRIRFVNSSTEVGSFVTWESLTNLNPNPGDDGWWIDDVRISETLDAPHVVTRDDKPPPGSAACAVAGCTTVSGALEFLPPSPLTVPGAAVTLSAAGSMADACPDGGLQYRFRDDLAGVLRDFSDNPALVVAPTTSRTYAVDVRCSTDPGCADTVEQVLVVECPRSGGFSGVPFPASILLDRVGDVVTVTWDGTADVDLVGGPLGDYPDISIFRSGLATTSLQLTVNEPEVYLLLRERGEFCNNGGSWNAGTPDQVGDRDSVLP